MKKVLMAFALMVSVASAAHAQKYFQAKSGNNTIYFEHKMGVELTIKGKKAVVSEITADAFKSAISATPTAGKPSKDALKNNDTCKRFCVLNELTGTGYYCVSKCDVDCCADVVILNPAPTLEVDKK